MHSTTYEELLKRVSTEGQVLDSLYRRIHIQQNRLSIIGRTLHLAYFTKRYLRHIQKLENMTMTCSRECSRLREYQSIVKENLSYIVEQEQSIIPSLEKINMPNVIVNLHKNILDQYEDKLENYFIATDDEIQELTARISEKMKSVR
jgi:hypothetical protein